MKSSAPEVADRRKSSPALHVQPGIQVTDWLGKLDDGDEKGGCPLNTPPFLDVANCLKSLPLSNDPAKVFASLHDVVGKSVKARNIVIVLLKQGVNR